VTRLEGRRRSEHGQTTPMIVGFFFILAILTAVVVDASAAYLQRQSLANLADGAALAGADGGVGRDLYDQGAPGERLPIDLRLARAAAEQHLRDVDAYQRYPGLRMELNVVDGRVVVLVRASLDLPLTVPGAAGEATIGARGSAGSVVDRGGGPP
jgi:hypothetical protein